MLAKSVQQASHRSRGTSTTVSYSTVWQLRLAASQWGAWDSMVAFPLAYILSKDRRILHQECQATDSLVSTLLSTGLASRMGEDVRPAEPLQEHQVRAFAATLDHCYRHALLPLERREVALAGLANLLFWLG